MIPVSDLTISNIEVAEEVILPSLTYKMDFDKGHVQSETDGIEALRQSVYCRLMTERGAFPIYSEKYGLPMNELIGQSAPLVYVSIASAITETLLEDDRITAVYGFVFDTDRTNVTVSFNVTSVFGKLDFKEVELYV